MIFPGSGDIYSGFLLLGLVHPMPEVSDEKRKRPRLNVQLPISFSGVDLVGEGIVSSLSKEGCAVDSGTPLPVGVSLTLRILIPDHYSPMSVDLASVRWALNGRFGLEFIRVRPEEQVRLGRLVKTHPVGPATS